MSLRDDEELLSIEALLGVGGVFKEPNKPARYPLVESEHVAEVRRAKGHGRWVYCKYCYRSVLPVVLHEELPGYEPTEMVLCSECGAGLTRPEPV